ncbi:hypothetical protein JCM11251_000057 [Rhodosporidiobolus azoricus]
MAEDSVKDSAERAALLQEIAELQAELASKPSTSAANPSTCGGVGSSRRRARVATSSWAGSAWVESVIRTGASDHESGGLHEAAGASAQTEGPLGRDLDRAKQLVADNTELTGISLTDTSSVVLRRESDFLIRQHALSGNHSSSASSITYSVRLDVREPTHDSAEDEQAKRDPGREYVVERMECEAMGGGTELQEALSSLRLNKQPNPPAFFSLLRQYTLLCTARNSLFISLSARFPKLVVSQSSKTGVPELVFSSSSLAPSLVLGYRLSTSSAPTVIRAFQPFIPVLAINTQIPPTVPSSARTSLKQIPTQFDRMLREGYEPVEAVSAIVKAFFRD